MYIYQNTVTGFHPYFSQQMLVFFLLLKLLSTARIVCSVNSSQAKYFFFLNIEELNYSSRTNTDS